MKISEHDGSKPFLEVKDVVMCRSGIQEYRKHELIGLGLPQPTSDKPVYKVYRPASAVIAAINKFKRLPLTKEHPSEFVNGSNWKKYAEGYTDSVVDVVSLDGEEIGLKSSLVFSTNEVYDYYLNNNREVSVGYTCRNRWVDNPEDTGYDIIMEEILDVNHLAITAAGRGGSRVAIIDSLIGGMKMFDSGIFHFLKKKGKTQDATIPFSKTVFDSLEGAKKLEGSELAKEIARVMDSVVTLKESETKKLLVSAVSDVYANIDTAIANKDDIVKIVDSLFEKAEAETLSSINDAFPEEKKKEEEKKMEDADAIEKKKMEDAEAEKLETEKKEADEKKKTKDTDGKGSGTNNISDSALDSILDSKISSALAGLPDLIKAGVAEALGIKADKSATGGVTDSIDSAELANFDMSKYVS